MHNHRKPKMPEIDDYVPASGMDNIEFPNMNAMPGFEHDYEEDYDNKIEIEKMLFYISADEEEDEMGTWNAPTRYQLFIAKCNKWIPHCIPNSKVLKISKGQHKKTGVQYAVVDVRILDIGAFSAPVNLNQIRNFDKNIDVIVQTLIKHFITAMETKKRQMAESMAKAILQSAKMDGPADDKSIIQRAISLISRKN